MTDITELVQMKGQKVEAPYYLAECTECGKMYPSSQLIESRNYMDGDADCYCPHCNATDPDIADCGSEGVTAWNYQQARIDALVEALEKAQKSNAFLKGQLSELANFNPDWDKLEASYESWREIAAELLVAKDRIAELEIESAVKDASNLELKQQYQRLLESRAVTDWIEHDGKWRPDSLSTDELVYLKTRKQELKIPYPAGKVMGWMHTGGDMDVMAYKLASPQARTVTVKLPRPGFITISGERTAVYLKADVDAVLAAAGIGEAE